MVYLLSEVKFRAVVAHLLYELDGLVMPGKMAKRPQK
jgi:hypothetical protein